MLKSYRQTINASPEIVFPLLCPVREVEWLDGWEYKMIYCVSGLIEKGAVFSTANTGGRVPSGLLRDTKLKRGLWSSLVSPRVRYAY